MQKQNVQLTINLPHTCRQSHTRKTLEDLRGSTLPPRSTDQGEKASPQFDSFMDTRIQVFITNTTIVKLPNCH